MRTDELRRYEMLQRVRAFGAAHPRIFPAGSGGAEALDAVSSAVTRLSEHATAKVAAAAQGRPRKTLAREALVRQLKTLSRCAKVIAEETPGFDGPFALPKSVADQRLLTTGRVFRAHAEPVAARFVELGLPVSFLADLDAAIAEFVEAIGDRDAGRDGQVASMVAIRAELQAGRAAVRRMHEVVALHAADDPAVLAVWARDRRVQGRGGAGGPKPEPEPEPEPGQSLAAAADAAVTSYQPVVSDETPTPAPAPAPAAPVTSAVTAPDDERAA